MLPKFELKNQQYWYFLPEFRSCHLRVYPLILQPETIKQQDYGYFRERLERRSCIAKRRRL